jgi:hypothetical protein
MRLHTIALIMATAGEPIKLPWGGEYGPDGPWQRVKLDISTFGGRINNTAGLWPGWSTTSRVLTPESGGTFTATNSSSANITQVDVYDYTDWESTGAMIHGRSRGGTVVDLVTLEDIGRWEVASSYFVPYPSDAPRF